MKLNSYISSNIQLWTFEVSVYDVILTYYGNIDGGGAEVNVFIVSQYHIM